MPTIGIADKTTLDAVLAYVDELEARLTAARAGYLDRLDAAISSRSAAADYTAVRAAKLDNIQGAAQFYLPVATNTTETYADALNISGTGYLYAINTKAETNNITGDYQITIDGVDLPAIQRLNTSVYGVLPILETSSYTSFEFKTSLRIQHRIYPGTGGSHTISTMIAYGLR